MLERTVYLPEGTWYDFWQGTRIEGGRTIDAAAPYDQTPVHIRAGSIIPFGPELQFASEKEAEPLTLYVYTGRDGEFTLYEDDGKTYQYEKGAFSQIAISWNDAKKQLTIGSRRGEFSGMLATRTIRVVFVSRQSPVPFGSESSAQVIQYNGTSQQITHE